MEIETYFKLFLLLIFFFASAFFSGTEVALFSLDKKKITTHLGNKGLISRYLVSLLNYPRRLLITILLGNTLFNVAATIVAVMLAIDIADLYSVSKDLMMTIQIILLTILIVIFGEIIPKVWATKNPLGYAKWVAIPLYWTSTLIYPVSETLIELIRVLVTKIKIKKRTFISSKELSELANNSHERGTIDEEEHELIHGIVSYKTVSVREVMTPRVDITYVSSDTGFDEVLQIITESGHSRIPLCKDDLDEIIGILYAKDLLPYIANPELRKQISLSKLSRKPYFVPEKKMINDLMQEFQEKNLHIGIVVDEYGGTSGLISMEDIIEEIVGEIRDEYDVEENEYTKIDENNYIVLGKLSVYVLNELLGINIASANDEYDTIGGLVLHHAGHIPKEGYTFELSNCKFTVKEVLNKRIKKVLVEYFGNRNE